MHHLAWTGGFDSTFRLLQLLEQGATVQPHYIGCRIDARRNVGSEIEAIRSLTPPLVAKYDKQLLPPIFTWSIPAVPGIAAAFRRINMGLDINARLGFQYEGLARYATTLDGPLEVCAEPGGRMHAYLTDSNRNLPELSSEAFGCISWPVLDVDKAAMLTWARAQGVDRFLAATVSCWFPTNSGSPCGQCDMCRRRLVPLDPLPPVGYQRDLSIIYSVHNRCKLPDGAELFPRSVRSVLAALSRTDIKAEIIVVDWESSDMPLATWLPALCLQARVPLRIITRRPPHCLGHGRNAGAAEAIGKALLFLDADMLVSSKVLVDALSTTKRGHVYAPICYSLTSPDEDRGVWRGVPGTPSHPGGKGSFGNIAFPWWLFRHIGQWREDIIGWGPEDQDMMERLKIRHTIVREYEPDLVHLWHPADTSNLQYARGKFQDAPILPATEALLGKRRTRRKNSRPKALLFADVRGWAFDRNLQDLRDVLQGHIDCEIAYIEDRHKLGYMPDVGKFDVIVPLYLHWHLDNMLPMERTVGALCAQYLSFDRQRPPEQSDFDVVNRYARFYCVNRRAFDWYRKECPRVHYLTNPVNMARHPEGTTRWDVLRPCWAGNSLRRFGHERDAKHFYDIIKPACDALGLELVTADYHASRVAPNAMPAWYLQSNLYVCASSHEGASNAVMEAMASGQVLVSTDAGNAPELYESQMEHFGESGVFLIERSRDALEECLRRLQVLDFEHLAHLGGLNRQEIAERWSWDQWGDRYHDLLMSVINANGEQVAWNQHPGTGSVLVLGESLGLGGAERLTPYLANAIVEAGYDVAVGATISASGAFAGDLADDIALHKISTADELGAMIDRMAPMAVLGNNCHLLHDAVQQKTFWHRPRNLTYLLHGYGDWSLKLLPDALSSGHTVLTMSENARDGILAARPDLVPGQVHIARTGIDTERFCPGPKVLDLLPPEWRDQKGPILGSAGRYSKEKAHPAMIAILGMVKEEYPDAKLMLIGGCDTEVKEHVEYWRYWERETLKAIEKHNLRDSVWLSGLVADPVQYMRLMDVFLLTSDFEDLPLVLLEAMACEVPLVSTAVGAVPALLADGGGVCVGKRGGTLSKAEARKFARAIVDLLEDENLSEVGKTGRRIVVDKYSLLALQKRIIEYLEEVICTITPI